MSAIVSVRPAVDMMAANPARARIEKMISCRNALARVLERRLVVEFPCLGRMANDPGRSDRAGNSQRSLLPSRMRPNHLVQSGRGHEVGPGSFDEAQTGFAQACGKQSSRELACSYVGW